MNKNEDTYNEMAERIKHLEAENIKLSKAVSEDTPFRLLIENAPQANIFERFSQLGNEKSRLYGGTGLGLPIAKGLANLLGGTIWLDSEPGKGSTFYFTIDSENHLINECPSDEAKQFRETYNFNGITIMIVEDDRYNSFLIEEILSETGARLIFAEDGTTAVTMALEQSPDLILMDIGLPDISGYEAVRRILTNKSGIGIIAQTAYASGDDRKKAFSAGCMDYISKPLKAQNLLAIINKYSGADSTNN